MLAVLSPAKRLDFDAVAEAELPATKPALFKDTQELLGAVKSLDVKAIAKLMDLSPTLARLNYQRYQDFDAKDAKPDGARPAAFAFDGDTYIGLRARELSKEEVQFAQEHVWILSGLYGILRPLDAILPYRLEMGSPLQTARGKNLYEFWGDKVAKVLKKQLASLASASPGSDVLVNLASNEYFSAVDQKALGGRVIQPVFKEKKGSPGREELKIVSFSAKRARGTMARYIVQHRVDQPEGLKDFAEDGYRFDQAGSTSDSLLFVRG